MVHHIKTGKYIANFKIININEDNDNHYLFNNYNIGSMSKKQSANNISENNEDNLKEYEQINTTIYLRKDEYLMHMSLHQNGYLLFYTNQWTIYLVKISKGIEVIKKTKCPYKIKRIDFINSYSPNFIIIHDHGVALIEIFDFNNNISLNDTKIGLLEDHQVTDYHIVRNKNMPKLLFCLKNLKNQRKVSVQKEEFNEQNKDISADKLYPNNNQDNSNS